MSASFCPHAIYEESVNEFAPYRARKRCVERVATTIPAAREWCGNGREATLEVPHIWLI